MSNEMPHLSDQPLVTVIIPCYNQANYLSEAIESVLSQTYRHFEIVVIDDGSPDNASEVAARYQGVRVIRQDNQGISEARNRGIRESRGDYLVFLDSDDRLLPRALEAGVNCMAEKPESALVFGRFHCMQEDGKLGIIPSELYEGDLYKGLLHCNCIGMVAPVMYKREIFDEVGGFDSRYNRAEDYHMYLRIARNYPTHRHEHVIANYRVHDSGASTNHGAMLRAVIETLKTQREFVIGDDELEKAYLGGLKFWRFYYGEVLYLKVARGLLDFKNIKMKIEDLWHLFRYYPQFIPVHGGSRWNKFKARFLNTQKDANEET